MDYLMAPDKVYTDTVLTYLDKHNMVKVAQWWAGISTHMCSVYLMCLEP